MRMRERERERERESGVTCSGRASYHISIAGFISSRPSSSFYVQSMDESPVGGVIVNSLWTHEGRHMSFSCHLI